MASNQLVNPIGANQQVTSFITMKTTDGELIRQGDEQYATFRANAAVAKGEVVKLVVPTATVPLSVTPFTSGSDPRLFAGIATKAAAAGATVEVCTHGTCEILVGTQTVAFGDVVLVSTTTGEALCSASDPADTVVGGGELGVVLAAKNATTLLAPARIRVV